MEWFTDWFTSLEWSRLVPELLGKAAGFLVGFAASWYLLFRRRLQEIQRFQQGDSDDILFQMHVLQPVGDGGDDVVLLFRNVGPRSTVNQLYDNPAAREMLKELADNTSLSDPVLATQGRLGFEILNDAFGHLAGLTSLSPFPRETWLFAMTCEDRHIVRKKCVRCFVIRPADLERFADWKWCSAHVRVEQPWHWFRVVALHQIGQEWMTQQGQKVVKDGRTMPLVNEQTTHNRIRQMSVGINTDEKLIGDPNQIRWQDHVESLQKIGLSLDLSQAIESADSTDSVSSGSSSK